MSISSSTLASHLSESSLKPATLTEGADADLASVSDYGTIVPGTLIHGPDPFWMMDYALDRVIPKPIAYPPLHELRVVDRRPSEAVVFQQALLVDHSLTRSRSHSAYAPFIESPSLSKDLIPHTLGEPRLSLISAGAVENVSPISPQFCIPRIEHHANVNSELTSSPSPLTIDVKESLRHSSHLLQDRVVLVNDDESEPNDSLVQTKSLAARAYISRPSPNIGPFPPSMHDFIDLDSASVYEFSEPNVVVLSPFIPTPQPPPTSTPTPGLPAPAENRVTTGRVPRFGRARVGLRSAVERIRCAFTKSKIDPVFIPQPFVISSSA